MSKGLYTFFLKLKILILVFLVTIGYTQFINANSNPPTHGSSGQMIFDSNKMPTGSGMQITSESPADAILAQTSYLAKVLIQANDIYPPSHVSTRGSGEIYASTDTPLNYNLKILSDTSIYRNALGAVRTSDQVAGSNKITNRTNIMRDWVEYHINKYCDPLSAQAQINNCGNALSGLSSADISNGKTQGLTSWDLTAYTSSGKGAFAADINAGTLFRREVSDPEAAMRYIYNISNVIPGTFSEDGNYTVPQKWFQTKNGRKVLKDEAYEDFMSYIEYQARTSLAQYAMMKILSERMQLSNIKIPVTTWDSDGNKSTTIQPTSRYGLLEFESNKRFKDPKWFDQIQQMPTPALLKEIAYMMAMQLSLEFKQYELQQVQTVLLASGVASSSQSTAQKLDEIIKDSTEQANNMANQTGQTLQTGSQFQQDVLNQFLGGL